MYFMFVTELVSQLFRAWLKAVAPENLASERATRGASVSESGRAHGGRVQYPHLIHVVNTGRARRRQLRPLRAVLHQTKQAISIPLRVRHATDVERLSHGHTGTHDRDAVRREVERCCR